MNKLGDNIALCICTSPLQAFLVINLIKVKKINVDVIYLAGNNDERTKYYFECLKTYSTNVYKISVNNRRAWSVILNLELILNKVRHVKEVYIASYNSFYPAYIVNRLNKAQINIFDDGSFTVIKETERKLYYPSFPTGIVAKIILKIYRINKINEGLLEASRNLYTIFPNYQQLVSFDKVIGIDFVLTGKKIFVCPIVNKINFFIGDVYNELSENQKNIYKKTINNKNIDYYIPHPRSSCLITDTRKKLSIHTIAEEFIINFVESGYIVNIFSFGSTVLFTLPKLEKLNKYIIRQPKYSLPGLNELADKHGIMFIDENNIQYI